MFLAIWATIAKDNDSRAEPAPGMKALLRILQVVIGLAFLAALGVYAAPRMEGEVDVAGKTETLRSMVFAALPIGPEAAEGGPMVTAPGAAPQPLPTASEATAAEVERVWRQWMTDQGLETGTMALIAADGTEYGTGLGRGPDDRRPIMSMSKAITGLCLDQVLAEQGLPWSAAIGDFPDRMSEAGITPRPGNAHLTLADMATHTAGLAPDLTQAAFVARTHGALGLHRRFTWTALSGEGMEGTPGEFFYSNVNYAALGVAIEALTGERYADACRDRIVTPLGLEDVVIEGRYGSLSSYAGWEFSAMNYARLARHWFAADQPHIAAPLTRPLSANGYGPGYWINGQGRSATVVHGGRMCHSASLHDSVGSLFIARGTGDVFVANWDGCLDAEEWQQLLDAVQVRL
jgi:CubicO group peptidase (beta-lactamase class C family)